MSDNSLTPTDYDPEDGNESNENLQNDSEENVQNENPPQKTPVHVPGMIERMIEEGSKKESEKTGKEDDTVKPPKRRDPSVWEHKSDDTEDDTEENSDQDSNTNDGKRNNEKNVKENNDQDPASDVENNVRDYKGSGMKLSSFRRVRSQKQKKYDRLVGQMEDLKADQKRGYRIIENVEGQISHSPINSSENTVISFQISDLDYQRFILKFEINDLDQKIKGLANKKRRNRVTKKKKISKSKQEDSLVNRVSKELDKASTNSNKQIVSKIESQVKSGNTNDAYNSLKSFLSQQAKTVAKKLDKDEKLEKNVLERVIDKLSSVQS